MKKICNILKDKQGTTLVEVVIATAVLTIISSAVVGVLYSSSNVTESNQKIRDNHETAVGVMDTYIKNADSSLGTDISVDIEFGYNSSHQSVDCVQIYEGDLPSASLVGLDSGDIQSVGIIKKK
jgi:type II secretory pathway pseudopilin PulG